MAVNFATTNLARIECDQVESDLYSVQNLISSDPNEQHKGFQVEYYIRPPINVSVHFDKYHLDLMFLELGLHLGQNKSNSVEVYAVVNNRNLDNDSIYLIAKCWSKDAQLTIVNNFYRPNTLLPQPNTSFNRPYTISSRNSKFCYKIKCIKIKILSTLNTTVPCLRLKLSCETIF